MKEYIGQISGPLKVIGKTIVKDGAYFLPVTCTTCGYNDLRNKYGFLSTPGVCKQCRAGGVACIEIGTVVGFQKTISHAYLVNSERKIDIKCTNCGKVTQSDPTSFPRSSGSCSACRSGYKSHDMTGEEFGDFIVTGFSDYTQGKIRIPIKCKRCSQEKIVGVDFIYRTKQKCGNCERIKASLLKSEPDKRFLDPKRFLDRISGVQKVISSVTRSNTGRHRVMVECIECGHQKSTDVHDLFRDGRSPSCTKCGAGKLLSAKSKIGEIVGALEIIEEKRNGHYKKIELVVKCIHCGASDNRNYQKLVRSAGRCKTCGSNGKKETSGQVYRDWKSAKRAFRKVNPDEKCATCGISTWNGYRLPMHIDHIIPASKGGLSTLDNMAYICGNCHIIKTALEHPTWEIEMV
jgi:hypothetical protein